MEFCLEIIVLREVRQKKFWFQAIWTCLCGRVVSIIHLPTLILTCLWTSANESPGSPSAERTRAQTGCDIRHSRECLHFEITLSSLVSKKALENKSSKLVREQIYSRSCSGKKRCILGYL